MCCLAGPCHGAVYAAASTQVVSYTTQPNTLQTGSRNLHDTRYFPVAVSIHV